MLARMHVCYRFMFLSPSRTLSMTLAIHTYVRALVHSLMKSILFPVFLITNKQQHAHARTHRRACVHTAHVCAHPLIVSCARMHEHTHVHLVYISLFSITRSHTLTISLRTQTHTSTRYTFPCPPSRTLTLSRSLCVHKYTRPLDLLFLVHHHALSHYHKLSQVHKHTH